jgi:hypothetical protein
LDLNTWIAYEVFGLAVGYIVWFFFLRNLRDLLARVSERNRAMRPHQVWLNFVPLFGLGWFIYTVVKIRDSVRAEFKARAWVLDGDLGYNMGLAAAILSILSFGLSWLALPVSVLVVSIGQLVCWIAYWVKTASLKNKLRLAEARLDRLPSASFLGPVYQVGADDDETFAEDEEDGAGPEEDPDADEEDDEPRCPRCGAGYEPGDRFCMSCGRRVP